MNDSEELINRLVCSSIIHAPALPFKRKHFCADMALITDKGNVKIFAEGCDLASGEEIFYLNLNSFEAGKYWLGKQGKAAWPLHEVSPHEWSAIDYVEIMKTLGLTALLKPDRKVLLYRDREAGICSGLGKLKSAKAISISSPDFCQKLVVSATAEFPCSIEIAINNFRAGELLFGLEEFTLPEMYSTKTK